MKKMNLKTITDVLSRSEMKKIVAGSGGGNGGCGYCTGGSSYWSPYGIVYTTSCNGGTGGCSCPQGLLGRCV
jgi:hypothetical protein